MKSIFKTFLLSLMIIANTHFAYAQTASILPPAKTTFLDNNGKPLVSGQVNFYTPGTTTRKTTWQDSGETIPNSNPVILDSAGRALILGDGIYRQQVFDRNNNLIWDANTSSSGSGGGGTATVGDGDAVGTIKPWGGMLAPNQYAFSYGQEFVRASFPLLFSTLTTQQNASCTSGTPALTGLGDTSNIPIGAPIESACLAAGATVISKTVSTVGTSSNAIITTTTSARFFPFGNGDGSNTFNVPDLRGRVIAGRDNMGGVAASRLTTSINGCGVNADASGAVCGNESQTLVQAQLPTVSLASNPQTVTVFGNLNSSYANTGASQGVIALSNTGGGGTTSATYPVGGQTIPLGGSNTPHPNVQPTETLNYIIKTLPDTNPNTFFGVASIGGMQGVITCGIGITCAGNNISAITSVANITVGSTSISGGVNGVLFNSSGVLANSTSLPYDLFFGSGRPWCDVRSQGATGDGHTDDHAAIQTCINQVSAFGTGGVVYFPASNGPYCNKSAITITGTPVVFKGEDQNVSTASCAADITMFNLNAPGSGIVDLSVYGKGVTGLPTTDTVFGANNPTVQIGTSCVNCIIDHIKVQGGLYAFKLLGSDFKIYRSEAGSTYGSAVTYIGAGGWLHRNAFDQTWPVSLPNYPLTANAWAASTSYTTGQVVSTSGYYIQCLTGGTSGLTPPALQNYSINITDGTAVWLLVAPTTYYGIQADTGASEVSILQQDLSGPYFAGLGLTNTLAGLAPSYISIGTGSVIGQTFFAGVYANAGSELIVDGPHIAGGVTSGSFGVVVGNSFSGRVRVVNSTFLTGTGNGVGIQAGLSSIIANNHINTNSGNAVVISPNINDFVIAGNTIEPNNQNGIVVQSGTSNHYAIYGNVNTGVSGSMYLNSASGTDKYFVATTAGNSSITATTTGSLTTGNCVKIDANGNFIDAGGTCGGAGGSPGGSTTQVQYNNAGAFAGITGATSNGTALTLVAPILGTPASGTLTNTTGFPTANLAGAGTGILTALTNNVGSAGAPVLFNGAGGTPTSMVGTNITGTAASFTSGTATVANAVAVGNITGAGSGVLTALAATANNGTTGFVTGGSTLANDIMVSIGTTAALVGGTGCTIQSSASIQCTTSASSFPQNSMTNTAANLGGAAIIFKKSRTGSDSSANDFLGEIDFNGFANTSYRTTVIQRVTQSGASSGSNIPSAWTLMTSNAAGLTNQSLSFDGNAHLAVTAQANVVAATAGCNGSGYALGTGSTDAHGWLTGQTTPATTCTITFGTAFNNRPSCTVSGEQAAVLTMTPSTTTLVVTFAALANYKLDWHCFGQ